MRLATVLRIALLACLTACAAPMETGDTTGFGTRSGPYLGFDPPVSIPENFAPGLVSTEHNERVVCFLDDGKVCVIVRDHETVFTSVEDGHWATPRQAPFSFREDMHDGTVGPDGNTLYFMSSRPTGPDDRSETHHLWTVEWTGTSWAPQVALDAPRKIPGNGCGYPTSTADGTVYFISDSRDGFDEGGIYRTSGSIDQPGRAELVERPINSEFSDFDPCVSPDGSYLIFNSNRPGGFGSWDTYLSFQKPDGSWMQPINLGPGFNSSASECCSSISSDGRALFFASSRELTPATEEFGDARSRSRDIYWVDTGFIDALRSRYLGTESSADRIIPRYREAGLAAAIEEFDRIHSQEPNSFSFLPNDLLRVCEEMIASGHAEDARVFFETLQQTLPETGRLAVGYALIASLNGTLEPAKKIVQEIESIDPSFDGEDVGLYLGHMLTDASRLDDALEIFALNGREHPDSYRSFYYASSVSNDLGETDLAKTNCLHALKLAPDNAAVAELCARFGSGARL